MSHYVSWAMDRANQEPWNSPDKLVYANQMYTRYDKVRDLLKIHVASKPRFSVRNDRDEERASGKTAARTLWAALQEEKNDDKILEEIIPLMDQLDSYPSTTEYLKSVCQQYDNWYELGLQYSDVMIERGAPEGYFHKARLTTHPRCDKLAAFKLIEEADSLGLCTYALLFFRQLWFA